MIKILTSKRDGTFVYQIEGQIPPQQKFTCKNTCMLAAKDYKLRKSLLKGYYQVLDSLRPYCLN